MNKNSAFFAIESQNYFFVTLTAIRHKIRKAYTYNELMSSNMGLK